MEFYYYRLTPPRPTFNSDMNEDEKNLIKTHASFWIKLVTAKTAVIFGPVFASGAVFGVAIFRAESHEAAKALVQKDPALTANLGFSHELHAMMATVAENC